MLQRVPRGSRDLAAHKLSSVIGRVVKISNEGAWCDLFFFAPLRAGHKWNLISSINYLFTRETPFPPPRVRTLKHHAADSLINLESRIC